MTGEDEPRAYTAAELQEQFMDGCRSVVDYWAGLPDKTAHERVSGALHSFLCLFDGVSSAFPCAVDLVASPHPEDKAFHQGEGENWVEPGTVLNGEDMLHELLYGRGAWRGRPADRGGVVQRDSAPVERSAAERAAGHEVEAVCVLVHGADAVLDLPGEEEPVRHPAGQLAEALGVGVDALPGRRLRVTVRESAADGRVLSGFRAAG